jgi:hypothetical protein
LLSLFEDHQRAMPINRTLHDWMALADAAGCHYHPWVSRYIWVRTVHNSSTSPEPVSIQRDDHDLSPFETEPKNLTAPVAKSRGDALTPLIEQARREAYKANDASEVFNILKTWALRGNPPPPLKGGVDRDGKGLLWENSLGDTKALTYAALNSRIKRRPQKLTLSPNSKDSNTLLATASCR